jgi:hypothetical protein
MFFMLEILFYFLVYIHDEPQTLNKNRRLIRKLKWIMYRRLIRKLKWIMYRLLICRLIQ